MTGCYTESGTLIPIGEVMLVNRHNNVCTRDMSGNVIMTCQDNKGREKSQSSVWTEGWRQLRCGRNGVEATGCVTPSGIHIPAGEVKLVNGSNIECKKNGSDVIMRCKDKDFEWQMESNQLRCTSSGSEVTGCVTASKSIPRGEMRVVDGSVIICSDDWNGGATVQCMDSEGRVWDEGSKWKEGLYQRSCTDNGGDITGCFTASGTLIPVGEVVLVNGHNLVCKKIVSGNATLQCKDREGQDRDQGTEWKQGLYQLQCTDNGVMTMGVTVAETYVPFGESKKVNDFNVEWCNKNADGTVTPQCTNINGDSNKALEWKDESYGYSCKGGHLNVTGCFTTSGTYIPRGQTTSVDGSSIACVESGNGDITTTCKDNEERDRELGSEWIETYSLVRCGSNGKPEPKTCVIPPDTYIPIGQTMTTMNLGKVAIAKKRLIAKFFLSRLDWTVGSISLSCDGEGTEPTGCVTASGIDILLEKVKSVSWTEMKFDGEKNML
ncbi:hypothetical protein KIN20_021888 [Parelaphostrongylus tenuis]|uniref:Sushi domain-containing protein n=1 Tax=Parelaphostrongylus tenuis TaxID=148309 RepID=A0AAD5N5N8_PARTN|nr:hypothetical protein KIN20_021888 [Parelaphostrongylus tenuis]